MKIIAFSAGDSRNSDTWSNVPYYLLKALENNGTEIIRENIKPFEGRRWVRVLINKILRFTKKGITFERTALYNRISKNKMLRAVKKNPDAELLLTFGFSVCVEKETGIKTLMLCDWDIEYLINSIEKRTPTKTEQKLIEEQSEIIDSASYVVSIFPNAYEEMKKKHKNVYYFGTPINLDAPQFDIKAAAKQRFESRRLLFIGKEKYLQSAKVLACAVESFNLKNPDNKFFVDLIGMDEDRTKIKSEYIRHYGYLKKDSKKQWSIYNDLLKNAFFFINTSDNWVGASSILDTAYLGIPCIINPNPDLVKTFGENIYFGYYCNKNSADEIEKYLNRISELTLEDYALLSSNAQTAVQGYTYPEYVKKIISLINN